MALSAALDRRHDLTLLREGARQSIRTALEIEGNVSGAARRLGVSRRALTAWLFEQPDIRPDEQSYDG
jgi:ActR/RegA family two-component response regulator